MTIIIFVLILGLLIFVHEFGHFFVARRNGVKAEEFGFGFPPRIFGFWRDDRKKFHFVFGNKEIKELSSTLYSVNWLPFGGFVKIKGESGEHARDKDSFASKPIWRRGSIILAGVAMNFLLAALLLSVGFGVGLPQAVDGLESYANIRNQKIEIVDVLAGSPAARAGLKIGDQVYKVDDFVPARAENLAHYFKNKEGQEIFLGIKREQEEITISLIPEQVEEINKVGVGIFLLDTGFVSYPWYWAIWKGISATLFFTKLILISFWELLKNWILIGKVSVDLSGPVGIAVLTGRVARLGFAHLLHFTSLLSINLAILNVLPIPALDGGRFLFLVIEKIRGKPVSRKIENLIHNAGFLLLLLLIIIVTYRDLLRFQEPILRFFGLK